jgi:hypothetical protein
VQADGRPLKLRADDFRDDLKRAGVVRTQLFERNEARRPIRVHDLRATFVTLSLASGKSETWVADRTGHRSSEMINRYRSSARTHEELALGNVKPLVEAIPELRSEAHGGHQVGTNRDAGADERARLVVTIARIFQAFIAEREGFEPSVPLRVHMISNHAPSATRSSLRDRRP